MCVAAVRLQGIGNKSHSRALSPCGPPSCNRGVAASDQLIAGTPADSERQRLPLQPSNVVHRGSSGYLAQDGRRRIRRWPVAVQHIAFGPQPAMFRDPSFRRASAAACFFAVAGAAQQPEQQPPPPGVAARFVVDGETRYVAESEVANLLATLQFRTARGKEALDHLVTVELVLAEARERGLLPSPSDVRRYVERVEGRCKRQGRTLDAFLAEQGIARDQFEDAIVVPSIAHERLVMERMGFRSTNDVTPTHLKLWVEEARETHRVVTDLGELGPDVCARIDGRNIPRSRFGETLLIRCQPGEYRRLTERIVLRQLIDAAARRHAVVISRQDALAEVEQRRKIAAAKPEFRDLSFEELLASQGLTIETFATSPVLLAQLQEQRIVEKLWPDSDLATFIAEHPDEVTTQFGPRRQLRGIFLRATEHPNRLVTRTFDDAEADLAGIMNKVRSKDVRPGGEAYAFDFSRAARVYSEHSLSKVESGSLGFVARNDTRTLSAPVLAAAWAVEPGETTEPVRGKGGVWVIQVESEEPPPTEALLYKRIRRSRARAWRATLLEEADLEIFDR